MLNFMAQVIPAVDAGVQVDAAYFDFKKAFDTVDNDVLLRKLADIGCTPHLLQFFVSYMKDRQHLPEVVRHATCLLFADDLKLLLEVRDESDCTRLQDDIDKVVKWSHDNKLYFNVSKCSVISFTHSRRPVCYEYKAEATPMTRVTQVRDLGVHLTPELTFREHIIKICKKAYRNLGFVLRQSQGFTNITTVRVLYDALVRSHLEYGGVIWAPHEAKYSVMLERVQNKFTRHLYWRLYGVYQLYPLMYPHGGEKTSGDALTQVGHAPSSSVVTAYYSLRPPAAPLRLVAASRRVPPALPPHSCTSSPPLPCAAPIDDERCKNVVRSVLCELMSGLPMSAASSPERRARLPRVQGFVPRSRSPHSRSPSVRSPLSRSPHSRYPQARSATPLEAGDRLPSTGAHTPILRDRCVFLAS
ncbi:hypothetical protein B5X24_HaOG211650 [Helicoverpa armigera]|uniref:Reverse transcriptase domain-containing protein n=1 Tax=Helicoverpa armigera TaxID=29058 RepID=A0A2W1B9V4_HELAM|nr:hypothetical protein B5X24_HaOG211650 [Helicoverpa armigera]